MNLHEYQSKQLFAEYGIPVPTGTPADSPEAAVKAAEALASLHGQRIRLGAVRP